LSTTRPNDHRKSIHSRLDTHTTLTTHRNGAGGAIYGELTTGSMQKVVDVMISHCGLGKDSIFIDVGAGLGKPNIHVAQVGGWVGGWVGVL
jgi:hypothetical protein